MIIGVSGRSGGHPSIFSDTLEVSARSPPSFMVYLYEAMARKLRFIPFGALVEVTCRTVHGRFLMRPTPECVDRILGVIGRAQRLNPSRGVCLRQIAALYGFGSSLKANWLIEGSAYSSNLQPGVASATSGDGPHTRLRAALLSLADFRQSQGPNRTSGAGRRNRVAAVGLMGDPSLLSLLDFGARSDSLQEPGSSILLLINDPARCLWPPDDAAPHEYTPIVLEQRLKEFDNLGKRR